MNNYYNHNCYFYYCYYYYHYHHYHYYYILLLSLSLSFSLFLLSLSLLSYYQCYHNRYYYHLDISRRKQVLRQSNPEVFRGYTQSLQGPCVIVCDSITFTGADLVWIPTPHVAITLSSSAARLMSMPYWLENSQMLISLTDERYVRLSRMMNTVAVKWNGVYDSTLTRLTSWEN